MTIASIIHLCLEKMNNFCISSDWASFGKKGIPGLTIGTVVLIFRVALRGEFDLMVAGLENCTFVHE
jgi:hypothetical protein